MRKLPAGAIVVTVGAALLAGVPVLAGAVGASGSASADRSCSGSAKQAVAERWSVRNLSDSLAVRVDYRPRATTVGALRAIRAPTVQAGAPRGKGTERKTFKVKADLVAMRRSSNGEIDVTIVEPGRSARTMVVSFPDARCSPGRRSQKRTAIQHARSALLSACGGPAGGPRLAGRATISGVGFFDPRQMGSGAAPNGIELGPALGFRSTDCRQVVTDLGAPALVAPSVSGGPAVSPEVPLSETPSVPPVTNPPPPPLEPPVPDPNDRPCTTHLGGGGSIESLLNASTDEVVCLGAGYYSESADTLILLTAENVRVQREPGAYPLVCGQIVARGKGSSVANNIYMDPHCAPYFNEDSPFNKVASDYPPSVPIPDTWLADFDGKSTGPLLLSRAWTHGKAIFKASPADPVNATFRIADFTQCQNDPSGCRGWQPNNPDHLVRDDAVTDPSQIPIPTGVACPGLPAIDDAHDRALVVVSADGKTAWEFWHCTHVATATEPYYTAAVAARWALDPSDPSSANRGYQTEPLGATGSGSARASGMPLLTTTITPHEAFFGINHPIGLTVLRIETGYVSPPASHTDVCLGCSHLKYGMLFVLNPAFPLPAEPTQGQINVANALKKYGAFIVDRGPAFELDGSPNEPLDPSLSDQLWTDAGLDLSLNGLNIKPSDFRYVPTPGAPPPIP